MDRDRELRILREQLGDRVITRREFINRGVILTGSLGAVLALAQGCAPAAPPAPTAASSAPTVAPTRAPAAAAPTQASAPAAASTAALASSPAAKQPKRGGTLTLGKNGDFTTMDPHFRGAVNQSAHQTSFNLLMRYDNNLQPQPELAESWQVQENKFVVKLRQGVKHHNGREFVADDVLFNIERAGDAAIGGRLVDFTKPIESVKALDKSAVEFTFRGVPEVVVELLDNMFIITKEEAASVKNKPVGTGPFKFAEWAPGDRARWTRNADYWKKGQPYVETLVEKAYNDSETQLVNLQAGTVDLIEYILAKDAERILADKNLQLLKGLPGSFWMFMVNVTRKPFDNKKVRQALAFMVDRKTISEKVFYNQYKPVVPPFYLPSHLGYDAKLENAYTFNLEKAKALLAEAGYPNGFEATITGFAAFPETKNYSQILMADAAKIGVKLKLDDLPSSQAYPKYLSGDFDILNGAQSSVNRDPVAFFANNPSTRLTDNVCKYDNPEYTRLVNEAAASRDLAKRKELYRKLNALIVDEAFVLPITDWPKLSAARSSVQGYAEHVDGFPIWDVLWLNK